MAEEYAVGFVGREAEVLFEEEVPGGYLEGFSEHYLRVRVEASKEKKGEVFKVRVEELGEECLVGSVIS